MSESIALDLRNDFFKNVMAKDIGFFDANRSGDLGKLQIVANINHWSSSESAKQRCCGCLRWPQYQYLNAW